MDPPSGVEGWPNRVCSIEVYQKSNPIELAEYSIANHIQEYPAFHCWVGHVLLWRYHIISKVKTQCWRRTHKLGIKITKISKNALEIYWATETNFWEQDIQKDISNVRVSFENISHMLDKMSNGKCIPGFQEMGCHITFNINMDGKFTRKARLVSGSHRNYTPASITYSSGVYIDIVRITFNLDALNDLDVDATNIGNAYFNAPFR